MTRTISFFAIICGVVFLAATQEPAARAIVPLIFQTTFNCPDWNQSMGLTDAAVCAAGDGISGNGAWTTSAGSRDQIFAAANNPSGDGFKGYRHVRGDGLNNQGSGLRIGLPTSVSEFWVRFYMRYAAGFRWQNGEPAGTKENYWHAGETRAIYFGFGFGTLRFVANGNPYYSTIKWSTIMGGSTGDGKWHLFEYYIKADTNGANGLGKIWVDGTLVFDQSNLNWNRGPWQEFGLGSNQDSPANGSDSYTDYDDLAVSTVGRIGPVSGGSIPTLPAAPTNLRIIR